MFLMKKNYTCIELGTNSIKAAQFKKKGKDLVLVDLGIKKLPFETIVDGLIVDDSLVAQELHNLISSLKHSTKHIITTVPNDNLLIRNIEMPNMDQKDIRESLKWEADEQLPYPVENAALDYLKVGETEEVIQYVAAAVRKNVVDNFLHPFERINLKPRVINVQPMALVSLLTYQGAADSNIAIIDIGASAAQITIANSSNIMLSRTIDTGGINFTNTIMDLKNIDYQEAEEEKKNLDINAETEEISEEFLDSMPIGMEMENNDNSKLREIASRFSAEITRSLDFFNMKHRDEEIEKIFVTGGAFRLKGLQEIITEDLNRELILIDPFKNIKRDLDSSKEELIKQNKYEFAVAVGLGVSEVMADES
jgi:type IV pilus assembly protein PilM